MKNNHNRDKHQTHQVGNNKEGRVGVTERSVKDSTIARRYDRKVLKPIS